MGVTNPAILENCIIDVALTGRPEFARAASNGQQLTNASTIPTKPIKGTNKGTIAPGKGDVIASIDNPGETAAFTFTGQAGQYIFLDIPATTLPNQCGGIGIKRFRWSSNFQRMYHRSQRPIATPINYSYGNVYCLCGTS